MHQVKVSGRVCTGATRRNVPSGTNAYSGQILTVEEEETVGSSYKIFLVKKIWTLLIL